MRLSRFAIAALALSSIGCLNPLDAPDGKAGFITLDVLSAGGGAYAARPFGVFYDETSLFFDRPVAGQCAVLPYQATNPQFSAGKTMNVGASVTVTTPTVIEELLPIEEFNFLFYGSPNLGGIAVLPGETIIFTIPGGEDFPATQISDFTPELFTYEDVGVPPETQALTVSWTPPMVTGSLINFALRYADDVATGFVNRQATCWFEDDGEGDIPSSFLDGWRRAQDDVREVSVTRMRSTVVQVADDIELTLVSTLRVPTPGLEQ